MFGKLLFEINSQGYNNDNSSGKESEHDVEAINLHIFKT